MPQKFMDVLMLGRCSHEFSWPRRGADGDYYQVCLLCAAEYKYDWTTMRRTERVEHAKPETTDPAQPHAREAAVVGAACAPPEARHSSALPREQDQHVV